MQLTTEARQLNEEVALDIGSLLFYPASTHVKHFIKYKYINPLVPSVL